MNIAINLLPFRTRLAGAGRYAVNVVKQLIGANAGDHYRLYVSPNAVHSFPDQNVDRSISPFSSDRTGFRIWWEQCVLPWQLRQHKTDVLFTPSVAIPLAWKGKKVTVIYDMAAEHPALSKYVSWRGAYVRRMTLAAARQSDLIVTLSEHSRREIAELAKIPISKIKLAPPGVSPEFQPVRDAEQLRQLRRRYHMPEKFILYLGTLEPGKNLVRLIQSFAQLRRAYPKLSHSLVLAGDSGWGTRAIKEEIARQGAIDIQMTGYVAEEDLPALYSAADLFVYPSLYEGFGLPPLEAMACGTPVVTSSAPALPEVVSGAALLVPPADVAGLSEAMARVLLDRALRERLLGAGLERAREFCWDKTARVIWDCFQLVRQRAT